jgi:hypothetical protein
MKNKPTVTGNGTMSIMEAVCDEFRIKPVDVKGKRRNAEFVDARRILVWYEMTYCKKTQTEAGRVINRDHATARNLILTFGNLYDTDKNFKLRVDNVLQKVRPYSDDEHRIRYSKVDMLSFGMELTGLSMHKVNEKLKAISYYGY